MKTLKDYLKSIGACESAVEWAGDKTIEQVVAECHRGDWLLWLVQKCGVELQPPTLAKGCCANTVRHLMTDERSLKAVDIAIAFGEGRATADELNAASAAHDDDADYVAYAAEFNVIQRQAADICRKHIGELIIEKVNQTLNPIKL